MEYKFNKYVKKRVKKITPQEATALWMKESYSYDIEYITRPTGGVYPSQRHLPRYHRNVSLTPVETSILNELRK